VTGDELISACWHALVVAYNGEASNDLSKFARKARQTSGNHTELGAHHMNRRKPLNRISEPQVSKTLAVVSFCLAMTSIFVLAASVRAEEGAEKKPPAARADTSKLVKLSKTHDIWLDAPNKSLIVDGQVCLREGFLEMFACPKGTKEHESVVSVNCDAMTVHAGLLALGAHIGGPVKFDPTFVPASGTQVDIFVTWTDAEGKPKKVRAQEWVRNSKTKKEMTYNWVFAGSGFFTDEDSGKRYYNADAGDLVCVSNFPTATLDLPIESSQANADLQFEAFTDHIPAKGTKVRLIFQPKTQAGKTEGKTTKPATKADDANSTKEKPTTEPAKPNK